MAAQGQAAIELAAFGNSKKMRDIRSILKYSADFGNPFTRFSFDELGTSREAIFAITLLRESGYEIEHGYGYIDVKGSESNG